jgi:hypothetical protein
MYFSSFLFLFLLRRQDALREDDDGICFFHWIKMRKRARGVFFFFFGGGGGGQSIGRIPFISYRFLFGVGEVARFPDELFHLLT